MIKYVCAGRRVGRYETALKAKKGMKWRDGHFWQEQLSKLDGWSLLMLGILKVQRFKYFFGRVVSWEIKLLDNGLFGRRYCSLQHWFYSLSVRSPGFQRHRQSPSVNRVMVEPRWNKQNRLQQHLVVLVKEKVMQKSSSMIMVNGRKWLHNLMRSRGQLSRWWILGPTLSFHRLEKKAHCFWQG